MMQTNPKVSVLMTIYNALPYLAESIQSVLNQTYENWELIAIENGSKDGSDKVLEEFAVKDKRIKIFYFKDNIGRTPALIHALNQADGEFIAVLDADDIALPKRFEKEVEFLNTNVNIALVGTWANYIDKDGKIFAEYKPPVAASEIKESFSWINPIAHSSVMYRRDIAISLGGYPANYIFAQDFALFIAIAKNYELGMIGEFLCGFRVLSTSMTRSPKNEIIIARESLQLFQLVGESISLSKLSRKKNKTALAIYRLKIGFGLLKDKSFFEGMHWIWKGIFTDLSVIWNNARLKRKLNKEAGFVYPVGNLNYNIGKG